MKKYFLGIDTGGTHTDVVVYAPIGQEVVATAKAETTHHDLAIGITQALNNLQELSWDGGMDAIERIHLSTTLATNAIAENLGNRVGLILMGYDQNQGEVRRLIASLPQVTPIFLSGHHDFYGREIEPLDSKAIVQAVKSLDQDVSGWAISGFFSVKNPAHELAASDLIRSLSQNPITIGSDLTGRLDAIRRAATAALNAGLVIIIGRLLDAVKVAATSVGLGSTSLMVVKGDGSLVSEEWARSKPIETVVSGPAAGLVGASLLCRGFLNKDEKDLWVMDVGGTTCDLAYLKNGLPAVNPDGAKVGSWNTMTLAVETRTRGLGGDSLVNIDSAGKVTLGPRRVLPLCRLASNWPKALDTLNFQVSIGAPATTAGIFFIPGSPPEQGMSQDEMAIIEAMEREVPFSLTKFAEEAFEGDHHFIGVHSLEHPSIMISAFTPTDAMSILGLYSQGSRQASECGAKLIGRALNWDAETVARQVLEEFGRLMAMEVVSYGLTQDEVNFNPEEFTKNGVFGGALTRREHGHIEAELKVREPVVLLGAPVGVLSPFMSNNLSARLLVPPAYEVASAVGAAASPLHLSRKVDIHALPYFAGYRLFLPDRVEDDDNLENLVTLASTHMRKYLTSLAKLAGELSPKITMTREDHVVLLRGTERVNMGASLNFVVSSNTDHE